MAVPQTPVYVGNSQIDNPRPTTATPVMVADITSSDATFNLDTHGFQYRTPP
ncbi:hypothetical protein QBC40DRAFT_257544 [Triangularia verruculosa]|uniref:Uncharacterized protein n=1 Tax=Triangularia verruculosa TaxID=2587418 RepID=A0AAN6XB18_9PEZI|nr:hypothetical protein QBC40DRAFT_257544 [Triangularia verruculosa]